MSPVLDIKDLSIAYRTPGGDVRAASHVNLTINKGEVVGLCGESGSGKSTLAYGACRLLRPPAVITSGSVLYSGARTGTVTQRMPVREGDEGTHWLISVMSGRERKGRWRVGIDFVHEPASPAKPAASNLEGLARSVPWWKHARRLPQ